MNRKRKQILKLKVENAAKKEELEKKQQQMTELKKNGGKPLKKIEKMVTFPGDYDKIVLGKKALFLKECSMKLRPVACADVKRGSVIITLTATDSTAMDLRVTTLVKKGLELDNFELPPGKVVKTEVEEKDDEEEKK